jgi:hypothetical protein
MLMTCAGRDESVTTGRDESVTPGRDETVTTGRDDGVAPTRELAADSLLLLLNAAAADCYFRLPPMPEPGRFEILLATAGAELRADGAALVPARSLALLAFRSGTRVR